MGLVALAGVVGWYFFANLAWIMPELLRMDPEWQASPHFTDPEEAGPDFLVQGEYRVVQPQPWGAQVIALGDGRFGGRILPGGLPGAGWIGHEPLPIEGRRKGDLTRLTGPGKVTAEIQDGTLELRAPNGSIHRLERVERESPTLGAQPHPRATVLFDGRTNAFEGHLDEAGHLMEGATSKDAFGDFYLHLEFRTPFEPGLQSQKRGNSGVYLQKRYEIQILDSFGLEGTSREAGAIYETRAPDLNMAFPPLAWQTYDLYFRAARFADDGYRLEPAEVTLKHNGVLVHDRVVLREPTGLGDDEGPEPGPLLLQDHANPVRYRNIWIVPRAPKEE